MSFCSNTRVAAFLNAVVSQQLVTYTPYSGPMRPLLHPALIRSFHRSAVALRPPSIPYVIEHDGRTERVYDIYSRLLKDRIVCLMGPVTDDYANAIVAQLLFLQSQSAHRPITMYINSPGGSVTAGMAIYDTMQYIRPEVHTLCVGQAASMGSLLLAAGSRRFALPNSRIMTHQPHTQGIGVSCVYSCNSRLIVILQGQATDVMIHATEIIKLKRQLNELYVKHTKQPISVIGSCAHRYHLDTFAELSMERDRFMSPPEALEFGLIDKILPLADKHEYVAEAPAGEQR